MQATAQTEYDVVVAGSGAAGLAAALTAKSLGLTPLVIEKSTRIGGTSARSGGVLWIPGNSQSMGDNLAPQDAGAVVEYLRNELGNRYDRGRVDAFLKAGPKMVDALTALGALELRAMPGYPDYHSEVDGAAKSGRSLKPAPFDGRLLAQDFALLEWPVREMMLFGRMMIASDHLPHYYKVTRSLRSLLFVLGKVGRYAIDRLRYDRGTELTGGNALIARLLHAARRHDVEIWTDARVTELIYRDQRVEGVVCERAGQKQVIAARATILATGGFSHHQGLRDQYYPSAASGASSHSLAPPSVSGDGAILASSASGRLAVDQSQPANWLPMSIVPRADGSFGLFPHLLDRNKPGMIAVNAKGERFANEADSYQDFVAEMMKFMSTADKDATFLISDHEAFRRYGLGVARPSPVPYRHWVNSGYLIEAPSIPELARRLGLDQEKLMQTVNAYNEDARRGEDMMFGKGRSLYNRIMGDPLSTSAPNIAPLKKPPYFAVRLVPGDIGSVVGIDTNADAAVLDSAGVPISGLFAVGNDMANVTAGVYPGAGATLGPAMTFAFRAAHAIAGVKLN